MPLEREFRDLLKGSAALALVGLGFAVVLFVVTRALLPRKDQRLLRVPAFFLFVHIGALILGLLVPEESSLLGPIKFVSLVALLFGIGRLLGLLVLEVLLGRRLQRPVPTILRDIAQGVVYMFLLLGALRALGFDPGSILTTGAVVTAVIGLSLQETLGNLVAGLSIQMQRPFDVGDWVAFDSEKSHIGRVV
ncbi:MAG: mechanosensitive ion channel, partial [Polyangiaceae bacterium]